MSVLETEMGSGRIQPDPGRRLARDFVHLTELRQELHEHDHVSGLTRARMHQSRVGHEREGGQQIEQVGLSMSNTRPMSVCCRR